MEIQMVHAFRQRLSRPDAWLRLSTLMRGAWFSVALLHGWLIIDRILDGSWAGFGGWLRAALCLAAIYYSTLKCWRVFTVFDNVPRKVFVTAIVLVLLHWMLAIPTPQAQHETAAPWQSTVLIILVPVMGALLGLAVVSKSLFKRHDRKYLKTQTCSSVHELAHLPREAQHGFLQRWHRPPPCAI